MDKVLLVRFYNKTFFPYDWVHNQLYVGYHNTAYFTNIDAMINLSKRGIVILEQDMDLKQDVWNTIKEEVNFKNEIIVFPYYLYPISTGLADKVIAHRIIKKEGFRTKVRWCNRNDDYCDYFGLGMIYMPKRIWNDVRLLPNIWQCTWQRLDHNISIATSGIGEKAQIVWNYGNILHLHR